MGTRRYYKYIPVFKDTQSFIRLRSPAYKIHVLLNVRIQYTVFTVFNSVCNIYSATPCILILRNILFYAKQLCPRRLRHNLKSILINKIHETCEIIKD